MGYSTNPDLVAERSELLAPLEKGETCQWIVKGGWTETHRTAYKIREGLRIAGMYPQRYPSLASAAARFSIHVVGKGLIEARLRSVPNVETAPVDAFVPQTNEQQVPMGRDVPTVKMNTAEEIISAWEARGPSSDPLRFTHTVLPLEELTALHKWATERKPKLMFLVGEHNQTLVLTLHDMSTREYAWTPPKTEKRHPREVEL